MLLMKLTNKFENIASCCKTELRSEMNLAPIVIKHQQLVIRVMTVQY